MGRPSRVLINDSHKCYRSIKEYNMYKIKKLPVKKRFLFTGDMQSGKTTDLIKRIITSLEENKNIVEVIINYNTNASMESTNRKLIKMGSSNIKIWQGYEGLEAIYYLSLIHI